MHFYSPRNGGRLPRAWAALPAPASAPRRPARLKSRPGREMGRADLTKTEAERLLDWLEANGCRHFEVCTTPEQRFAVRWWN